MLEKNIPYSPYFGNFEKRAQELVGLLHYKKLKIAFVECSVGGFLSYNIVKRKGASKIFIGSIVPYSYDMKNYFDFNSPKGAVSEEFVDVCAEKFISISGADVVVCESSILGPDGGTPQKPVGLSFVSVRSKKGKTSFVNVFRGDRKRIMENIAAFCFSAAKNHIIGWDLETKEVSSTFVYYNGRILVMKRSRKVGTYKGMWGVASGHIEKGETSLQTAFKELEEETSMKKEFIKEMIQGSPFEFVDPKIRIRWVIHPFLAISAISPVEFVKIDWEHTSFKLIRPSELNKLRTAPMIYEGYLKTVFRG
ncbi:MAG: CinA family protein [Candidatus Calescibacterium sp.]|nr:CinA family protein [Candidatus Calescibacterium sp.]